MSDDPDFAQLGDRLEADDGRSKKGGKRQRPSIGKPLGALALLGLVGVTAYSLSLGRDADDEAMATAEAEDFQGAGDGFGAIAPPATASVVDVIPVAARPADPPVVEPEGPSETELAMMETLTKLQEEMNALREQAAQRGEEPAGDEGRAQIDALSARINDLTAQTQTLQAEAREAQAQARESAAQARLLQSQLDADAAPVIHGGTGEPLALGTDEDAAALDGLADQQAKAEEERQARIASPVIAFGGSSVAPAGTQAAAASGLGQNEDFLRQGARPAAVEQAVVIANPDRTVIQGTVIQAAMETAIDSSLPGAIRAVVSEDVHSYDGSRVLIPRGSKLIGRYNSQVEPTQRRLMVAWDRIITPDGQSVTISAYGADELGRSGTTGRIDRRLGTRFGSAALVSLISALPSAAAASVDDPLAADLAEELGEGAEDAAGSVLDQYLSVPPTIYIDQGARITVMVDRDLELY